MARCVFTRFQYLFDSNFLFRFNYLLLSLFVFKSFIIISNSAKSKDESTQNTSYLRNSHNLFTKLQNTEYLKSVLDSLQNSSIDLANLATSDKFIEQIYGKIASDELTRNEQLSQMSSWLSNAENGHTFNQSSYLKEAIDKYKRKLNDDQTVDQTVGDSGATAEALRAESRVRTTHSLQSPLSSANTKPNDSQTTHSTKADEEEKDDPSGNHNFESNEDDSGPAGTPKAPPCAHYGRYYCSYKEDYPIKVVTEVTKYYKWPLEKLFRDLRHQVMPTLANDNSGGLVCDSITRIVRPGWSKNTNGRWLVVINTDHYQQYVTEVICRHGTGSYCNFIPPCYHSSCRQRYNTQKLLVIDPWNPYKGPFISEFLFPSCCVCYIPAETAAEGSHSGTSGKWAAQPNQQSYSSPSGTVSSIDKSAKVS